MTNLLIDAELLACPSSDNYLEAQFQNVFTEYLSRLCDLTTLRSTCRTIRFWRDEELSIVLHDQNCFPFRHSLNRAFEQLFDPLEFQIEDVNILATALLEKSIRLESEGDVVAIAVSKCSVHGDPAANRSELFLNHLCRLLALALPVLGNGAVFNPNTFLASAWGTACSANLLASYHVDVAEFADGQYATEFEPTSVQVANFRGAIALLNSLDLIALWAIATEQTIVEICAISASISHQDPNPIGKIQSILKEIDVGSDFILSARPLGFMHDATKINRLLRVCVDLILARNMADSHWLRTGRGANDSQRTRGEWKAWRHDVDDEFHLHYWRNGSRIELANVVTHNNFAISR